MIIHHLIISPVIMSVPKPLLFFRCLITLLISLKMFVYLVIYMSVNILHIILWMQVLNIEVYKMVNTNCKLLNYIKTSTLLYFDQVLRNSKNNIEVSVMTGLEEGTRKWGRSKISCLDNITFWIQPYKHSWELIILFLTYLFYSQLQYIVIMAYDMTCA